jgi:hypothetical protein
MSILEIILKNPSAVNQIAESAIDEKTNFYISVFLAVLSLIIGVVIACWIYVIEERRKANDKENELKRYKEGLKSEEQQRLYNHDLDVFDRALESGFNKIFILGVNALSTLHKGRERIIDFIKHSRNNHVYILLLDPLSDEFRKKACEEVDVDFNDHLTYDLRDKVVHNNTNQNQRIYTENESKIVYNYFRLISEFQTSLSIINDIKAQLGNDRGGNIQLKVHGKIPNYAFTASYCYDTKQKNDYKKKGIAWINIYKKNSRGLMGGQFMADREKDSGNKLYNEFVTCIFCNVFDDKEVLDDDEEEERIPNKIPNEFKHYDVMIKKYNNGALEKDKLPEIMKWNDPVDPNDRDASKDHEFTSLLPYIARQQQ